jgi:hypothetical protein
MKIAYSIRDRICAIFSQGVVILIIASHSVARRPYLRIECEDASKFQDHFGYGRSVGKEESLFTYTGRHGFACISDSLDVNVL